MLPAVTRAPVPYAALSVCVCVCFCAFFKCDCEGWTLRKMSSMCSHVCVLICLVSVLIMLIMRPSGVCLCDCLPGLRSKHPQPALFLPAHVRVSVCVRACLLAGMSVSAIKDGSGMLVRSVVQGGSVCQDGRLGVGDAILAINGEPTSNLSNARARAVLRRHSVIGPEMR